MALRASGTSGELRKGHQVAARLSHWTLEAGTDTQRVDGTAEKIDAYWIDQSGLSLHLEVGSRQWVWRDIELLSQVNPIAVRLKGLPDERT